MPRFSGAVKDRLFYNIKQSFPSRSILVTKPDQPGFTYDAVFGYKTPEARILRAFTVITHHPIIIHLESIGGRFFSIQIKLTVLHVKIIVLIHPYCSFINWVVFRCQRQGNILFLESISDQNYPCSMYECCHTETPVVAQYQALNKLLLCTPSSAYAVLPLQLVSLHRRTACWWF